MADLIGFSLLDYIQPNRVLTATRSLCTRPSWLRGINGLGDDGVQFVNPFLSLPPSLPQKNKIAESPSLYSLRPFECLAVMLPWGCVLRF